MDVFLPVWVNRISYINLYKTVNQSMAGLWAGGEMAYISCCHLVCSASKSDISVFSLHHVVRQ